MTNTARLWYSFDIQSVHISILFSQERSHGIFVSQEQLSWLEQDLAQTNKKTIVCLHHSLADQDLADNHWFSSRPTSGLIQNRKAVRALLDNAKNVVAVLQGHLHWNKKHVHNDIAYFSVQSFSNNINPTSRICGSYAVIEQSSHGLTVDPWILPAEICPYIVATILSIITSLRLGY